MKIVGYVDTLSVEPGGTVRFMVSSEVGRYRADLVRVFHGDPSGPGLKTELVKSSISGEYEGRLQRMRVGSYVHVRNASRLDLAAGFTVETWIYPTMPGKERQALVSCHGVFELRLAQGRLELEVGGEFARLDQPIEHRGWYFVSAKFDPASGEVRLSLEPLEPTYGRFDASATIPINAGPWQSADDLLIAAAEGKDGATHFYNGKIDMPRITTSAGVVAAWDFSADISTRRVRDLSGNGLDGRIVNMPTRAVTGHNWDGAEMAWKHAPEQYGAIHFHDDDLDDAGWDVDFEWTVPEGMPSGVYAVRLHGENEEDYVPFFVRPKMGKPTSKILFLAPVFSYLAYSNEQILMTHKIHRGDELTGQLTERRGDSGVGAAVRDYPATPHDQYIVENHLLSTYDRHSDGSGVCYSSWLRPLVNMRPHTLMSALNEGEGAAHQLSADLHLVDWLHEQAYEFDVVTDVDLHREGAQLLKPYRVVLTGSHAEYWSREMLDATTAYLTGGGRLMHLSGNGLYWVTQFDPEEGHTVEIRRAPPGSGQWRTEPGEDYLSTTGELGGLWRFRGRAPQRLVGVGTTAAGTGRGRPYERQPESRDPRAAFVFEGIEEDELIGDFPSLVSWYGAAGLEFDRLDYRLGTPPDTILLASATGFSDNFLHVVEEVLFAHPRQGGSVNPLVRADMVLVNYPNGGAVFTPGSMTWCACLSYNSYDNNVSRITSNVLDRFAS